MDEIYWGIAGAISVYPVGVAGIVALVAGIVNHLVPLIITGAAAFLGVPLVLLGIVPFIAYLSGVAKGNSEKSRAEEIIGTQPHEIPYLDSKHPKIEEHMIDMLEKPGQKPDETKAPEAPAPSSDAMPEITPGGVEIIPGPKGHIRVVTPGLKPAPVK